MGDMKMLKTINKHITTMNERIIAPMNVKNPNPIKGLAFSLNACQPTLMSKAYSSRLLLVGFAFTSISK
jgi:hypothetical protein